MIKEEELEKAAHLSRILLSSKDKEMHLDQVSKILAHFKELQKIDTSGVEPMVTPTEMENVWRPDDVDAQETQELMDVAPDVAEGQYKVPQVVSG